MAYVSPAFRAYFEHCTQQLSSFGGSWLDGTGDDNCHYQNMESLTNELVAKDKYFEMLAYPNRTHAIEVRPPTGHCPSLPSSSHFHGLPSRVYSWLGAGIAGCVRGEHTEAPLRIDHSALPQIHPAIWPKGREQAVASCL